VAVFPVAEATIAAKKASVRILHMGKRLREV
jgi:hypothetical protein